MHIVREVLVQGSYQRQYSIVIVPVSIIPVQRTRTGFIISTIAKTQRVAMLLSMLISLLPTFLLSGFVFPIEDMPVALQLITYLVPARYFLEILRGIFMKGVGLRILWVEVVWLIVFTLAMLFISAMRFRKRLET